MEKSKQAVRSLQEEPFYSAGLRFSCKRCSSCCRYDAGFVFISENDLEKMTSALEMDRESFLRIYCRWVPNWRSAYGDDEVISLKEKSNKDCIFWDNGCKIYEARPLQCVTFPFWDSILSSSEAWEMAASGCTGMNSGDLHSKDEIEKLKEMRMEQPIINRAGGDK